ncbi:MAG: hypothetical protein CBD31_03945 [Flavobacteriaceae bacterium TMED171]|nr:hypothetical protein [Flavobacteriaceae bacterium]OUW31551.1 MAG: hypothetical protein CBD31_03945 [Flavobacteriaceae bacterium TMED171]|tara:strand:- start:326 stop:721 length:396 start_codon:yes stop_codon:yes gene_type:complete
MKKILLIAFSISLTTLSAAEVIIASDSLSINIVEEKSSSIEEKALIAIQTENYAYMEQILQSGTISPRMVVDGKPLIIYAAIYDKAEMILLLASYGAMLVDPICEEGKDIMEYAKEFNAIHAQAQIIIIKS